jgi:Icc-related predicted phosphoesterase
MRIYFCSDIHASRKCWKKFLNSWKFYEADHIIVGGDITGKFVVPIVDHKGDYTATFMGIERKVGKGDELETLKTRIADAGQYPFVTTPEEYAEYEGDQAKIDQLFRRLVMERTEEWMAEADQKLRGTGVRCFVSGANDDFFEVDDAIARSDVIEDPNGQVVELEGGYELLGMGYGNLTPWACPRDIPEEELANRIDKVAAGVRNPDRAIFSLHVPPLGSGLDIAPRLDDYLRPRVGAAGLEMIPVGSSTDPWSGCTVISTSRRV